MTTPPSGDLTRDEYPSGYPVTTPTPPPDPPHLEYGVVVDGCEVEAEVDALQTCVCQVVSGTLVDVPLSLTLAVVRQPVNLHKPDKQDSQYGQTT